MAFLSVPNEILIQVIDYLDHERDINAVSRVNLQLYNLGADIDIKVQESAPARPAWMSNVKGMMSALPRTSVDLGVIA
jgi:hypothetical protein